MGSEPPKLAENLAANRQTLKVNQSPITLTKRNVISEMTPAFYFLFPRWQDKLKFDLFCTKIDVNG